MCVSNVVNKKNVNVVKKKSRGQELKKKTENKQSYLDQWLVFVAVLGQHIPSVDAMVCSKTSRTLIVL